MLFCLSKIDYMNIESKPNKDNNEQESKPNKDNNEQESKPNKDNNEQFSEKIMSEVSFKNIVIEESDGELVYSEYNDFDLDGTCEMFAVVGENIDDEVINGEIWFANQSGAYKIDDSRYYWKFPRVYLFDDNMFIVFEEFFTTGSVTYLWGVQNGKPFQPSLTTKANGFSINKYNEVVITNSTYDGGKIIPDDWEILPDDEIWAGHTFNQYYYFWDGICFKEYGAIEITIDELLGIDGTDELIDYIADIDATINEIYFRENNIIQINYQKKDHINDYTQIDYHYIMFRYEGEKINLDDCEMGNGNILKALNTSLAVYPDDFDINAIQLN